MTETIQHPSLAAAMHAVCMEVGYVYKGTKVSMGKSGSYQAAGEAAFLRAIRPALLHHGILPPAPISMVVVDSIHEELKGKYGPKASRTVRIVATYRIRHAATGEHIDVQTMGEGQDSGDKAANKAMTIAYKYALRQTFGIETGDDPDRERPELHEPPAPVADPRLGELQADVAARLKGAPYGLTHVVAHVRNVPASKENAAFAWGSADELGALLDALDDQTTQDQIAALAAKEQEA